MIFLLASSATLVVAALGLAALLARSE